MTVEVKTTSIEQHTPPVDSKEVKPKTARDVLDELSREGRYREILTSSELAAISPYDRQSRVMSMITGKMHDIFAEMQGIEGMGFGRHASNRRIHDVDLPKYTMLQDELNRLKAEYHDLFPTTIETQPHTPSLTPQV